MKLILVKQGTFLGTMCDFYVDEEENIYMSRTQIGYALGYANPSHAILVLHQRHKEQLNKRSVEVRSSQFETTFNGIGKNGKAFLYIEQGIYAICRYSNKKIADDFNDWVYETVISIRKNGFYIATEKDKEWIGIREETKAIRKQETDTIKAFTEYAKEQGSKNYERYYISLTNLANRKVGIQTGDRDNADQNTLLRLKTVEGVIGMRLGVLMKENLPYKDIYKGVKEIVDMI